RAVLRGICFDVDAGCHVALVGPSGIGKSTLVRLIGRLFDPTEGRVRIDGIDIRQVTIASLRSQISVVLQDSILFSASVRDNIACGDPHVTPSQIEEAARLANAHAFIEQMPDGYDTVLGERGATLSRGQRQRIAIARAAIRDVPLLILDEPTAGLDDENEQAVTEALLRLSGGRTTFLVTHNLALAARMDLIVYLDHGQLAELGPHDELLASAGPYAASYRTQTANWR
ncbi:MAG: ABC transporter ATP-binding protein, partial [Pirellulales bacterium]